MRDDSPRGRPCKRRLTWPQLSEYESETAAELDHIAAWDGQSPQLGNNTAEEGCSPCPRDDKGMRTSQPGDALLLRSPTHDGVMFTQQPAAGQAVKRLCIMPQSSDAAVAAAPATDSAAAYAPQHPKHNKEADDALLVPASSSSRRTWEVLFAAGGGLQQPAASPATPGAAGASTLPAAPRKRSVEGSLPAARTCRAPSRAARALPGMAPSCAADLQQVRAWLTALEAQ